MNRTSTLSSTVAFLSACIALVLSLGLAVLPYLYLKGLSVPPVISYVGAFGVLCFAYFFYSTYQTLIMKLECQRELEVSVADGLRLVEIGDDLLYKASQESSIAAASINGPKVNS